MRIYVGQRDVDKTFAGNPVEVALKRRLKNNYSVYTTKNDVFVYNSVGNLVAKLKPTQNTSMMIENHIGGGRFKPGHYTLLGKANKKIFR